MTEAQAREEICRVGKSLFERGYVHATAGNISLRLDQSAGGGHLITPTDACLGWLDPARLARIDAQGRQLSGDPASKTLHLHRRIYEAAIPFDANTRCIIHTHSTHCVALSLQAAMAHCELTPSSSPRELLPALTPYFVMKVGHVPLIAYSRPGAAETADLVARTIAHYGERGTPIRAVMLERLGPNVWHDSPMAAMGVLEELEETARLMCLLAHKPDPLNPSQIDELRLTFKARW
jgi:ribulose-5-phosphate 4-epimerase/fuculose-1-phosphate aldolase